MRRWHYLILAFLALAGTRAPAMDFTGSYVVQSPEGPFTITLVQDEDGAVTGTLTVAGRVCSFEGVSTEDEEEAFVEAEVTCKEGNGADIELSWDEEEETYYLFLTPYDDTGTPRLDLSALYEAAPGTLESEVSQDGDQVTSQTTPADSEVSPLVGIWATQVMINAPEGSIATQLLMEFRADGTLVDLGSRALGGVSGGSIDTGTSGGGETAVWRSEGNTLHVSPDGAQWVPLATFEVSRDQLFLRYYDGDQKLWYRQR